MLLDYTTIQRVFSKIAPGPNGCWEWQGVCPKGYGRFSRGKYRMQTHRLMWELINGPIPDGILVCHACDNKRCCNPAHLWLGTNADNTRDMMAKGRDVHPCIPPDETRGERNSNAKLTEQEVRKIRELSAEQCVSQRQIAKQFGVARGTIRSVLSRRNWSHVE